MTAEARPTHWIAIEIELDIGSTEGRQRLRHAFNLLDILPSARVELNEFVWDHLVDELGQDAEEPKFMKPFVLDVEPPIPASVQARAQAKAEEDARVDWEAAF